MKKIFAIVVSAPILALFVGIGVLAFRVADKWDERNTDVLISNLTMACGLGGLVIALGLTAFVGLVFYARWQNDRNWNAPPAAWSAGSSRQKQLPPIRQPPWFDPPPVVDVQQPKGYLHSAGPSAYEDLDESLFGESFVDDMR